MTKTIREPARDLPVLGEYDVVVCGGGPAGCAAAIAAARHGARTLLVEREGFLGGATVAALVNIVLSSNGVDFQGIWHEWARALQALGGLSPLHWEERMDTRWLAGSSHPEMVKLAWDRLLSAAGVEILHYAWTAGAIVDGGVIRGVVIETKGGRQALLAQRVIDSTGDADVCAYAGAGFDRGIEPGKPWTQGVALNSLLAGLTPPQDYRPGTIRRSAGPAPLFQRGLFRFLKIDPLNPRDLSRLVREAREMTFENVCALRRKDGLPPIPEAHRLIEGPYIAQTASQPGIRASRRVHGLARVSAEDAFTLRKYPDGIARASWEIDLHEAESPSGHGFNYGGVTMDMKSPHYKPRQRKTENGDWFDIRYGAIVAADVDHLFMAGRCISSDVVAHASLRIQQTCMALGQAAGVAAALSLAAGTSPRVLDPARVVRQLEKDRDVEPAFEIQGGLRPQPER